MGLWVDYRVCRFWVHGLVFRAQPRASGLLVPIICFVHLFSNHKTYHIIIPNSTWRNNVQQEKDSRNLPGPSTEHWKPQDRGLQFVGFRA